VLTDIRLLCQHLNLEFDGTDLQLTSEGGYDVLLFPHAPEQEVDRFHFEDFYVSFIAQMSDAMIDVKDRHQILGGSFLVGTAAR